MTAKTPGDPDSRRSPLEIVGEMADLLDSLLPEYRRTAERRRQAARLIGGRSAQSGDGDGPAPGHTSHTGHRPEARARRARQRMRDAEHVDDYRGAEAELDEVERLCDPPSAGDAELGPPRRVFETGTDHAYVLLWGAMFASGAVLLMVVPWFVWLVLIPGMLLELWMLRDAWQVKHVQVCQRGFVDHKGQRFAWSDIDVIRESRVEYVGGGFSSGVR